MKACSKAQSVVYLPSNMVHNIAAACSLVINPQGLVLAVSRRNDPTDFGLPGGKREGCETPLQTAIRETFEETRVKLFHGHMVPIYAGQGRKFYCATYLATKYDDSEIGSSEEGVVRWLDYSEVLPGTFRNYNARLLREILRVIVSPPAVTQVLDWA